MVLASLIGFLLAIAFVVYIAWRLNWNASLVEAFAKLFNDESYRNRRR